MRTVDKKSIGDYLKRLELKAATGLSEGVEEDGGALVATQIQEGIFDAVKLEATIYNQAQHIPVTVGGMVKVPYANDPLLVNPTTGIRAYYVDEAEAKTLSKGQVEGPTMTLRKLVVRVPVTDELNMDSPDLADWIIAKAGQQITYRIEKDMFLGWGDTGIFGVAGNGNGASIFTPFTQLDEALCKTMLDALHPLAYKGAAWYITAQQYTVLLSIAWTTPNALTFEGGKYFLFGLPVTVMPHLTETHYPIVLGNFGVFGLAHRKMQVASSGSIRFYNDEREYRIELRVAGEPLVKTSDLDDGETYGWFVLAETPEDNNEDLYTIYEAEGFQGVQGTQGADYEYLIEYN